jgi:phosphoglycerate dehydrogenase-like enzyme
MTLRLAICTPVARPAFEQLLQPLSGVRVQWVAAHELPAAAAEADGLVLPAADYTPALAAALHQPGSPCQWLQTLSAGYETLVVHGVPERVQVTNAGSVWSPMVAEHAMGLMLAVARRVPRVLAAQATGRWDNTIRQDMLMLFGSHLVIVGMGSIGGELARRARAFGMRITGVSRSGRPHPDADEVLPVTRLHEALSRADYVVCAAPGSPTTDGLIGAPELAACPPHAVLVNVGRGSVVDTDALVQALRDGTVAAAALDVTEPEPLPDGHPLWALPNALVSPHLGGAAPARYNDRLARHVAANVQARLAGAPLHDRVNPRAAA